MFCDDMSGAVLNNLRGVNDCMTAYSCVEYSLLFNIPGCLKSGLRGVVEVNFKSNIKPLQVSETVLSVPKLDVDRRAIRLTVACIPNKPCTKTRSKVVHCRPRGRS